MGLLSYFSKREDAAATTPTSPINGAMVRPNTIRVNNEQQALTVGAFHHAVNLRAKTFARASIEFQRKLADGTWQTWTSNSVEYRHLNYLLHVKPNSRMNAPQMWEQVSRMRDLEGHCAIYLRRVGNHIHELIPCHSDWNHISNTYTLTSDEFGLTLCDIPAEDVIAVRGIYSRFRPEGISLQKIAERTLSLSATAESFSLDTMAKGGTFKAIIKQDTRNTGMPGLQGVSDAQFAANAEKLQEQLDDGADLICDPSCAELNPINQSFQDLQVNEHRKLAVEDIARVCGVPLPLMFSSTNAVYKSIDDAWHTFKMLTIQPMWDEVCIELTSKFLDEDELEKYRFYANSTSLCLEGEAAQANIDATLKNAGILTANEIRLRRNLSPLAEEPAQTQTQENK